MIISTKLFQCMFRKFLTMTILLSYMGSSLQSALASEHIVYVVQPGDTLSNIADAYNTTVEEISTANNIRNLDFIWVGQTIKIPAVSHAIQNQYKTTKNTFRQSSDIRTSVSEFLDKPFIQEIVDERVYYSFTPVAKDDKRIYWFQSTRNHAHENLAAVAYARLGKCTEAQGMLRAFYYAQNNDGGFPYLVTTDTGPGSITNTNITLPVLAWEALQIYYSCKDKQFLKESFEAGIKNDDWWWSKSNRRDHDKCQGMFFWKNHWESVRDDSDLITWTTTNGVENQCSVDINAYIIANDHALYEMAVELGDARAYLFQSRASHLTQLMNTLMWNEEDSFYYGISKYGGQVRVKDIGGLMPLYAEVPSKEQAKKIVQKHLLPGGDFHTKFGLPSLGKREAGYGSSNRWKGGMWPSLTLLIVKGLSDYGYINEAQHITNPLVKKLASEGTTNYWEFYDAETGAPSHAQNYIWTATILPMAQFARLEPPS